jgi:hypothetical protein
VKKWEGLVLLQMQVLQAQADADQITVECGNQIQELSAAQEKHKEAQAAYKTSDAHAKKLMAAVQADFAEKELDYEEINAYIQVILPLLSYFTDKTGSDSKSCLRRRTRRNTLSRRKFASHKRPKQCRRRPRTLRKTCRRNQSHRSTHGRTSN